MAFTQVTVSGTYKLADGSAAEGTVRFTPSEPMRNAGIRVAAPVVATLDGDGDISTSLAATTDAGTEPEDVAYLVEERIVGQPARSYYAVVPHSPASLDLADVTPAVRGPALVQYLTQSAGDARYALVGDSGAVDSVNGATGVVVLDADDLADGSTKVMMTAAERALAVLHTSQLDALDGVSNIGNSGTNRALTPGGLNGTVKLITLDNNCTFTFNNPSTSVRAFTLELILTQDGTGSRVATWPGTVKWAGGAAPTLSTAAAAVDRLVFVTYNQGTTWYGDLVGKAYA